MGEPGAVTGTRSNTGDSCGGTGHEQKTGKDTGAGVAAGGHRKQVSSEEIWKDTCDTGTVADETETTDAAVQYTGEVWQLGTGAKNRQHWRQMRQLRGLKSIYRGREVQEMCGK